MICQLTVNYQNILVSLEAEDLILIQIEINIKKNYSEHF